MTRRTASPFSRALIGSLLPPREAAHQNDINEVVSAKASEQDDLLERLPTLLAPKELAALLGVSPETVRRRIRNGKQATVEVLGIKRITATSASEQVRARVVMRLPGRYRPKSSKTSEEQGALPMAPVSSDGSPKNSDPE